MSQLDYQNECGLIRYPFRDSASLLWTNTSTNGTLSNLIVRDAQLCIFDGTTANIQLNTIIYNGSTWQFNFTGGASISITVPVTTGINTYSTRSGSNKLLILDIDGDALTYYFTTNSLLPDTYTFDSSCILCLSCFRLASPNVTRIRLDNTNPDTSITTVFDTGSVLIAGTGVPLNEGANTKFTVEGTDILVDVQASYGQGQYNGCILDANQVLTINNTAPDISGNYTIDNDGCYSTYAGVTGLHISNSCNPSCTSAEILNLADYYNRVSDLANQLLTYVQTSNTSYNSWIAYYNYLEGSKLLPISPYILAQCNSTANKTSQFHNITVGIYNPSKSAVTATVTLSCADSEFQEVAGSAYININSIKTIIPDPVIGGSPSTLLSMSFPCNTTTFTGLVLSEAPANTSTVTHTNLGLSLYDATFLLTSATGQSSYVLPLNPQSFNYNLSYTVEDIYATDNETILSQYIQVKATLIDPTQPTGATSLGVTLGGALAPISTVEVNELTLNNVSTGYIGTGFTNISVDFANQNYYDLALSLPSNATGTLTITFVGNGPSGSANKTLTITL